MELLKSAIAQALLTKKPIPDVPLLTLVRESLIEHIRTRFPESTGTLAADPIQASCFGVVDFRKWLECVPPKYRNIKIDVWIKEERSLQLYTGRFFLEKEVMNFPMLNPVDKVPVPDYAWEILPFVRDHRDMKDSDVFLCILYKDEKHGKRTTKCAFEIFVSQPNAVKKVVQMAQREIRRSVTTGASGEERHKLREYNVRWVAPGLEVMSKVTELYAFLQQQQLYLSAEIEKKVRRVEDARLETISVSPDQPPPEARAAAQESLAQFFDEFRDALYRQRDQPIFTEPVGGCSLIQGLDGEVKPNCPTKPDEPRRSKVSSLFRRDTLALLKTSDTPPEKIHS